MFENPGPSRAARGTSGFQTRSFAENRGLSLPNSSRCNAPSFEKGKALAGGPGAAGWMQQREAVPEFPPLHDSADSDSDRENEKRPRV
ncbi:hypothetical protein HN011_006992 [Eciton burchellii]|nr:hypothetical protein HN011_006992 [Eciton burchellii]